MNWYKRAQGEDVSPVFSREAIVDLARLNRTLQGKTLSDIRDQLISAIKSGRFKINNTYPSASVKMYGAEPMGLGTQGYRIGLQICKDKNGKKFTLIRRIFEHHDEYEKWYVNHRSWSDECGSYEPNKSIQGDEPQGVPFDPKSPRAWLVASVRALLDGNSRAAAIQKNFLRGRKNDDLMAVMALIDSEGDKIRGDIKTEIYRWLEEHWDMNE